MFSALLGEHLLRERVLDPRQLGDVLERMDKTRLKVGVLAINAGYMTAAQVEEVHRAQTATDRRFGDLAVEKGFLSPLQMDELLAAQRYEHLVRGQTLVDMELMTMARFERVLQDYKERYGFDDASFDAAKKGDVDALVDRLVGARDLEDRELFVGYISLFARHLVRFVDRHATLDLGAPPLDYPLPWASYQVIHGPVTLFTALSGTEELLLCLGEAFSKETLPSFDDLARASVEECLNQVNGLFTVNMSNQGVNLEMDPPGTSGGARYAVRDESLVTTAFRTCGGVLYLLLSHHVPREVKQ